MRFVLKSFSPIVALALAILGIAGCNSKSATPAVVSSPNGTINAGATPGSASLTHPSGYSVSLTLPSTSDGSTGSIAATIQTALPAGFPIPASIRRGTRTIGTTVTQLVYLVLTPTSTVTFSATPGFNYTLPTGTTIAAGSSAYVAMYDPALSSTGWSTILGPGSGSSNGGAIAFPGANGSLTLKAGVSYAFMLFSTPQAPVVFAPQSQCPSPAPNPTSPPSPLASPSPASSQFVAMQVLIDKSAQTGPPCVQPQNVNIYIVGTAPSGALVYVMNAQGATAPWTSNASPLPFYAPSPSPNSGNASQVIQVPNLSSARLYIAVNGSLAIPPGSKPTPWSVNTFATIFDWFEFTMPANGLPSPSLVVNSTQIQMIGMDMTYQLNGTQKGAQIAGLKAGFMTAVNNYNGYPSGSPWPGVMFAQWPTRILGPNGVQFSPGGNFTLPGFVSPPGVNPPAGQFLDSALQSAWRVWRTNCLQYNNPGTKDYPGPNTLLGQVDQQDNFVFYDKSVSQCNSITPTSTRVATLPSPFNPSYQTLANQSGGACTTSTSWFTATSSVLLQNGPFTAPAILNTCSAGTLVQVPFPENATYPKLAAAIGNAVSTAINRGLFSNPSTDQVQPECPGIPALYSNSNIPYVNYYGAALWNVVNAGFTPIANGKPSGVYAIPYDDQCGYSSALSDSNGQSLIITINGN